MVDGLQKSLNPVNSPLIKGELNGSFPDSHCVPPSCFCRCLKFSAKIIGGRGPISNTIYKPHYKPQSRKRKKNQMLELLNFGAPAVESISNTVLFMIIIQSLQTFKYSCKYLMIIMCIYYKSLKIFEKYIRLTFFQYKRNNFNEFIKQWKNDYDNKKKLF